MVILAGDFRVNKCNFRPDIVVAFELRLVHVNYRYLPGTELEMFHVVKWHRGTNCAKANLQNFSLPQIHLLLLQKKFVMILIFSPLSSLVIFNKPTRNLLQLAKKELAYRQRQFALDNLFHLPSAF
jgi:hypothetical protein